MWTGDLSSDVCSSDLIRERARLPIHGDQPWTDRLLLLGVVATGFVGLPAIAGLDVFRWHLLPLPGALLSSLEIGSASRREGADDGGSAWRLGHRLSYT